MADKYFSYAFERALKHHKFMIGLIHYGGGIQFKIHQVKPGAFLQSESLIKEILVAFSGKVARES